MVDSETIKTMVGPCYQQLLDVMVKHHYTIRHLTGLGLSHSFSMKGDKLEGSIRLHGICVGEDDKECLFDAEWNQDLLDVIREPNKYYLANVEIYNEWEREEKLRQRLEESDYPDEYDDYPDNIVEGDNEWESEIG